MHKCKNTHAYSTKWFLFPYLTTKSLGKTMANYLPKPHKHRMLKQHPPFMYFVKVRIDRDQAVESCIDLFQLGHCCWLTGGCKSLQHGFCTTAVSQAGVFISTAPGQPGASLRHGSEPHPSVVPNSLLITLPWGKLQEGAGYRLHGTAVFGLVLPQITRCAFAWP